MTADIYHLYSVNIETVFNAYKKAIKDTFNKDAESNPFHTLNFPLSFSFRYNMNGGACYVHFMPYKDSTAVDVHYSIVQLGGARYKKHDKDLTTAVESILGLCAQDVELNVNDFLSYKEQPNLPSQEATSADETTTQANFCFNCGTKFAENDSFCRNCGTKRN